jgi:retron-type reverse transcriptase
MRPLGIVADRVAQQALKIVFELVVEADFLPCSFGFRPRRSAYDALQAVRDAVRAGGTWVVDADIAASPALLVLPLRDADHNRFCRPVIYPWSCR